MERREPSAPSEAEAGLPWGPSCGTSRDPSVDPGAVRFFLENPQRISGEERIMGPD